MNKLFKIAGFTAFISIIFLNAFVDLGHKIIIQNTVFKIYDGNTQVWLTALVNGMIVLPFVMLFTPAGFCSDRFTKPAVIKASAAVAFILTCLITLSYYQGWYIFSFGLTLLLAIQSAFYSPAKYGYIKELVGTDKIVSANAVVQATTITAILLGIFAFSILFEMGLKNVNFQNEAEILQAIAPAGWLLIASTLVELILSFRLPVNREAVKAVPFDWKKYRTGKALAGNLKSIYSRKTIWLSVIGLSVFWGISQVVLASFPAYAKEALNETNTIVIQGLLAMSGIGIIMGSIVAGKASKNYIETGLVPIAAIGIVVSLVFMPTLQSSVLLALDILALGFFGGMFLVPLNALIQYHAGEHETGTVLAGNNFVQNVTMLLFLSLTVGFAYVGMSSGVLFYLLAAIAAAGAVFTLVQLPQSLVRYIFARAFATRYSVKVNGFKNLPSSGGVLLLGNHISWIDWAMVQIASPRPVRFVMHKSYYSRWYMRWFLDLVGVIPISSGDSKDALKTINQCLKNGEVVCLFPEGSLTKTGQMNTFRTGFERVSEGVENGVIVPFYIQGLWGSQLSHAGDKLQQSRDSKNRQGKRNVIVAFGPQLPLSTKADELKRRVFDVSIDAWKDYIHQIDPLPLAWMKTVRRNGKQDCISDSHAKPLNGYKALTGAIALSRLIEKNSPEQNIGLFLPTTNAGILTNMAALIRGRTVVNLNYTASIESLLAAVEQADIKTIYTAKKFISKLEKKNVDCSPLFARVKVVYLEDMKDEISGIAKLLTLLAVRLLPAKWLYKLVARKVDSDSAAAILFSSGSEGKPKGVVLSHQNIMGNIKQVSDVLNTQSDDTIMGTLPLFHAFGLTVTGLMPLVEGIPVVFHPDPTDVVNVAKAIGKFKASIFCATSTFLGLFNRNRKVEPLMLDSLRIVVAGAERLNQDVRKAFKMKFNKDIYEGYGATETTPVASVNVPDQINIKSWRVQAGTREGSVGMPLPGTSFRIVDPESLQELTPGEDGLILIGGTQVMQGYLNQPEKTAAVIVELEGQRWYKTGDKGHVDKDGFLTIVDRYSRFAKIGGEMVSLSAVEEILRKAVDSINEDIDIAAINLPDLKKGEKIVILFNGDVQAEQLRSSLIAAKVNPMLIPASFIQVDEIPRLGTGKTDFSAVRQLALELDA